MECFLGTGRQKEYNVQLAFTFVVVPLKKWNLPRLIFRFYLHIIRGICPNTHFEKSRQTSKHLKYF